MNYYNEWDPYAASWLRQLVEDGHIPKGRIDERDINIIEPEELVRYSQCHFFAGIGGWVYALRLANWGDRKVWTGSCPCQPFSVAGKKAGATDKERNLWPVWFNLIKVVRPDTVFGEQVASAVSEKYQWLDAVSHDLEDEGYRIGAGILPACSVQAPHIRQRLWFVADTNDNGRDESMREISGGLPERTDGSSVIDGRNMADTEGSGGERNGRELGKEAEKPESKDEGKFVDGGSKNNSGTMADTESIAGGSSRLEKKSARGTLGKSFGNSSIDLANPNGKGLEGRLSGGQNEGRKVVNGFSGHHGTASEGGTGHWGGLTWVYCKDKKIRPVKPGIQPLAYGVSARVGKLRAIGNAIVPQVAAEIITAYMEEKGFE